MEIQQADIAYRRRVKRTVMAVAILLLIVLLAFHFWLRFFSARVDTAALVATTRVALTVCFSLIVVCIAALGAHLLMRGNLIVQGRRFPPRDVRAIRDTPVREGDAAIRIGRTSQAFGLIFFVVALLVAGASWLWVGRF